MACTCTTTISSGPGVEHVAALLAPNVAACSHAHASAAATACARSIVVFFSFSGSSISHASDLGREELSSTARFAWCAVRVQSEIKRCSGAAQGSTGALAFGKFTRDGVVLLENMCQAAATRTARVQQNASLLGKAQVRTRYALGQ